MHRRSRDALLHAALRLTKPYFYSLPVWSYGVLTGLDSGEPR